MTEDDLGWAEVAWEQYEWCGRNDKKVRERINVLVDSVLQSPFTGIGKPEPLRGHLSRLWSRRITREHRLVYEVHEGRLIIHQCRFHY